MTRAVMIIVISLEFRAIFLSTLCHKSLYRACVITTSLLNPPTCAVQEAAKAVVASSTASNAHNLLDVAISNLRFMFD